MLTMENEPFDYTFLKWIRTIAPKKNENGEVENAHELVHLPEFVCAHCSNSFQVSANKPNLFIT